MSRCLTLTLVLFVFLILLEACTQRENPEATRKSEELKREAIQTGEFSWDFETAKEGQVPPEFRVLEGDWVVEREEGNKVLTQKATNYSFPAIVAGGKVFADFVATVKFRPISGQIDASGGIIFRFVDKGHYYVMRANALEDNLSLYIYVQGRRYLIIEDTVKMEKGRWYTLKVECQGDRIKGYLDDKLLVDHHDSRYFAGQVGLWTKADSVTEFDNFRIIPYGTSSKSRSLESIG